MQVIGTVCHIGEIQSGESQRGSWKKREFVVEIVDAKFPKKVAFSMMGDMVDNTTLNMGEKVTVSIELSSREYNNRWYTEARAWKVEKADSVGGGQNTNTMPPPADDMPF